MTGEDRNDKSIPKCSERDESGLLELDESRVLEIEDHLSSPNQASSMRPWLGRRQWRSM